MPQEPSLIQAFPQGLQGLLGLKGQGFPHELLNQVSLQVEALELYLIGTQEGISFTGVVAALGSNLFAEKIPPGELWRVWDFSLAGVMGAAEAIQLAPAYQFNGSLMCLDQHQTFGVNDRLRAHSANVPFWAWQDGQFGFHTKNLSATPTVSGRALISRIRV